MLVFQYERQRDNETLIGLTEELDKEWKDVSQLLAKGSSKVSSVAMLNYTKPWL